MSTPISENDPSTTNNIDSQFMSVLSTLSQFKKSDHCSLYTGKGTGEDGEEGN